MRRALSVLVLSTASMLAPACGGGGSSSGTANLRFVQGSIDTPVVDFVIDGKEQSSDLLYGNASSYVSVKSGTRHVQVVPVNSKSAVLDQNVSLAENANETIILTGLAAQSKPLVLNDGSASTGGTSTTFQVRVVNISTKMGPADVYILPAGTSLTGATAVSKGLDFDQDTGYQAVNVAGSPRASYTVYMMAPGTQSVLLVTGPLNFTGTGSSANKQTVLTMDAPAGGFTFSALSDQ